MKTAFGVATFKPSVVACAKVRPKLPEPVKGIQTRSANTGCPPTCRFRSISVISTTGRCVSVVLSGVQASVELNLMVQGKRALFAG